MGGTARRRTAERTAESGGSGGESGEDGAARRVIVFAGGDFTPDVLDGIDTRGAAALCADRGLAHCLEAGLPPALLIGDFDSVPSALLARESLADVPRLSFPAAKNESDLELALATLADGPDELPASLRAPDEVVLVGVSGGRTDHCLFNWLLAASRTWPFDLRLLDASVDAVAVTPERPLSGPALPAGRTVSLLPLGRVTGVSTGGLRYRLAGATLDAGTTLGLSNVADGEPLSVRVAGGMVLVMRCREDATR